MAADDDIQASEYWRQRGEELRNTAGRLEDRVMRAMALKVDDMYADMAGRAAEQERARSVLPSE